MLRPHTERLHGGWWLRRWPFFYCVPEPVRGPGALDFEAVVHDTESLVAAPLARRRYPILERDPRRSIRVNERIGVREVRVILDDGDESVQLGVLPTRDALAKARELGLDLVEVSPTARPPVCRIMDFGKYKYEQSKKAKQSKKRQHQVVVKEIKLRPKIEKHDYEFKKKHAIEFLEHGDKVKVTLMFRGREMAHTDLGRKLLDQLTEELKEFAKVESPARQEGRTMIMYLAPSGTRPKPAPTKRATDGAEDAVESQAASEE
jgi:translation initiation factor IF-3